MRRIIIDTDGKHDASEAIRDLAFCPKLRIEAITTVASSLTAEKAAANVLHMLENSGLDLPVFAGLNVPLVSGKKIAVPENVSFDLLKSNLSVSPGFAPNVIASLAEEPVEIVTMGPLSNIAMAVSKFPEIMKRNVTMLYILGGMIFHGDVGPMSEYNIACDPYAADYICKVGIPMTLLPLEVGSYRERAKFVMDPSGITKSYRCYERVETEGTVTYGANINDVRDRDRKEFVSQGTILLPFNCTLVADNAKEEIRMEV